ncbi:MAG: hypothetical protein SGI88_02250 [Candidatus Hydrogenedentes bacterium]|nr:hypothetical protein [Candidatus Hydrogenedentota bacterium]
MSDAILTSFRILLLRATREELESPNWRHFLIGLCSTWIVGIGRHWDHDRADFLERIGIGSVVYVFLLSAALWFFARPLANRKWPYRNLLIYVTLTAPPGLSYAIPLERFVPLSTANAINAWFLVIVAAWRIAMYVFYIRRMKLMAPLSQLVVTLLPVLLIICTLTALNLDRVVFDLMRGVTEPSPNDASYHILLLFTFFSFIIAPMFLGIYLVQLGESIFGENRNTDSSSDCGKSE